MRGQQVALDREAARVPRLAAFDHVQPRTVDELLARLRRDAQLAGELVVAEPVQLPPQQRVPLRRRERGDVGQQALDRVALLEHRVRCRREHALRHVGVVGHRREARAAELVQAAVADEPVQPGGEADGRVVAAERAMGADQRLLDDVLGELATAPEDARGVPLEPLRVALVDELERGLVAVPQARRAASLAGRASAPRRSPGDASTLASRLQQPSRLRFVIQPVMGAAERTRIQARELSRRSSVTRSPR